MIINLSTSNTIQRKILLLTMIPALLKYIFIATIKKRFGWLINIDNNQLLDIIFWFDMVYLAYIQIWFLIKRNYFNKKIFLPIIILLISYALSWTYGAISCNMVYPGGMFCHLGELQYLMPMVILVAINIIWTIIILIKAKQKTA